MLLSAAGCGAQATPPSATPRPSATPSATFTAQPSATPTFTATASPTPTATPTPSATATPSATPTVFADVRAERYVNIRRGPGADFAVIGALPPAAAVQVIGRNDAGDWLQIRRDDGDDGWVSAGLLQIQSAPQAEADEPTRLSEETRIVVEVGSADAADSAEDGILVINIPIADVDSMAATATAIAAASQAADATPTRESRPDAPPPATPRFDVKVFAFCDNPAHGIGPPAGMTAGSTIQIFWAWFASSETQLRQHIVNAAHELRVNGQRIDDVDQWRLPSTTSGGQFVAYWFVPFGPLEAGEIHISYRLTWSAPISDGFAHYGPGTANEFEEESCRFVAR